MRALDILLEVKQRNVYTSDISQSYFKPVHHCFIAQVISENILPKDVILARAVAEWFCNLFSGRTFSPLLFRAIAMGEKDNPYDGSPPFTTQMGLFFIDAINRESNIDIAGFMKIFMKELYGVGVEYGTIKWDKLIKSHKTLVNRDDHED